MRQNVGALEKWGAAAGAAVALSADVVYGLLIGSQNAGDGSSRPIFVAAYIGVLALVAIAGVGFRTQPISNTLRVGAAVGLGLLGILAAFSIGFVLIVAAVLIGLSYRAGRLPVSFVWAGVGVVLSLGLLVAGLYVTDLPATCPAANAQGGGSTMFHGSYSFTCHDGHMTLSAP